MCSRGVKLDESLQNVYFGWFWMIIFSFFQSFDACGSDVWARTAICLNTMGVELKCGWELGPNSVTVALLRMKRKQTDLSTMLSIVYDMCSTIWRFVIFCRNFKDHDA